MDTPTLTSNRLRRLGWATLVLNLLVVLWGAWVRASGSGAGCGNHWPLCNGTIIPQSPTVATLTELTHRITSGMALLAVVAMVVIARADFPKRHRVRRAAWISLLLIVIEALIGAGLVKFELVADNDSLARALTLGAHLLNTQLLLAAIVLTTWWATGNKPIKLRSIGRPGWWLALGSVALLAVGLTGAIASLGDTLFPARSLGQGLVQDLDPTSHLLLRLRVLHPVFALSTGLILILIGRGLAERLPTKEHLGRASSRLTAVVIVQWLVGISALLLLVPVPLQLTHLLVADLLWLSWVMVATTALAVSEST